MLNTRGEDGGKGCAFGVLLGELLCKEDYLHEVGRHSASDRNMRSASMYSADVVLNGTRSGEEDLSIMTSRFLCALDVEL